MSLTTIAKRLEKLGLSEKEAIVYPALLKLEAATVRELTEETGLNRSSLYVVLDRLQKRGLASITRERGVRKYLAAPPERLALTAKELSERSLLLFQNLATLFPELRSTYRGSRFKPKAQVIEGKEGLRKGFENTLTAEEKIMRVFSSTDNIFKSLPEFLPLYVQKRIEAGIKMYGIHPNDRSAQEMIRRMPNKFDEVTLVPKEKFLFPSDLAIYDNKISFMSHEPPFTVTIESKEISEVMKVAFDLAQQEAARFKINL